MAKKAKLLWMDLEMTGLDPRKDKILEVACIASDWKIEEIAGFQMAVKCDPVLMDRRMVGDFWEKNKKVRETLVLQNEQALKSRTVEEQVLEFIDKHFGKTVYLAGNSIHQDRKFIEKQWPELNNRLHYRMLDVSAWKIYFEGARRKKFTKMEQHRALDDIRGSMEEFRWYLKQIS